MHPLLRKLTGRGDVASYKDDNDRRDTDALVPLDMHGVDDAGVFHPATGPVATPDVTSVEGRYAATTLERARKLLGGRRNHPVVHLRTFHDDESVSDVWYIEITGEEYRALLSDAGREEPQEGLLAGVVCPQCGALGGSSRHLTHCGNR